VKLQVLDGTGKVVWEGAGEGTGIGLHDFTWDGKMTGGDTAEDGGVYTLKVTATNANGGAIDSQTLIRGRVTGVEMYDGAPYLVIGDSVLPLSTVISLNEIREQADNDDAENPPVPDEEVAA
jgi:flagellar basal-body rod modification protein FlgD